METVDKRAYFLRGLEAFDVDAADVSPCVIVVATRLAKRTSVERFTIIYPKTKFSNHSADKVIRLATDDEVVTECTELRTRVEAGESHYLVASPYRRRE
jgi:hypothetical protein